MSALRCNVMAARSSHVPEQVAIAMNEHPDVRGLRSARHTAKLARGSKMRCQDGGMP